MKFDDITWMILRELQNDGRITFRQLAEKVGLTAPAVTERVRKLEESGVIAGYSAQIDATKVGLPITAVIRLNASQGRGTELDERLASLPEVLETHRVTGTESHVVRAVVSSTAHLERLLHEVWEFADTITNIVTSSPVPRRGLPLPPPSED